MTPRDLPPRESGFSIVVLLAGITIMLVLMGAAVPTWRYVMQNEREEELYFRGDQIARAVERYQRKNGNALPISLEVLVKGHYLRKAYTDPMTRDGKWRIIHPGEAVLPGAGPTGSPRPGVSPPPSPSPTATPTGGLSRSPGLSGLGPTGGGQTLGAILGVASTSPDASLRVFNGRTRYDQWLFLAGQPRRLGRDQGPIVPAGGVGVPGGGVGVSPSPVTRP